MKTALTKLKRTSRRQRWEDARRVIIAGLGVLSHPEDRAVRGRFNQIVDAINKQLSANATDAEIVLGAISRGAKTIAAIRNETFFDGQLLEEILSELEASGQVRRVSRAAIEKRDQSRERSIVLGLIRESRNPITLEELRDRSAFSRRHLNEILSDLKTTGKVSRTKTGFITTDAKRIAAGKRTGAIEHDEDCLCRICLTPRSKLKQLNGG
jgi:predicted transcriptional regulator of viral defense system